MTKYSISADTLEELLDAADHLRSFVAGGPGPAPADAPAAGEAPKRQTRKRAEAPSPIQPEAATGANPFAAPPADPAPASFAPASDPSPFSPGAANPHANAAAERPAVTKFKELLSKLSAQHGEPQVYSWAITKAFGLSPSVTKEEFLSKLIHDQSDEALTTAYKQGGGQ